MNFYERFFKKEDETSSRKEHDDSKRAKMREWNIKNRVKG